MVASEGWDEGSRGQLLFIIKFFYYLAYLKSNVRVFH